MLELLWLLPFLPFTAFVALAVTGSRLPRRAVSLIGAGAAGGAAVVALSIAGSFIYNPPAGHVYSQTLWTWMEVGTLKPGIAFFLDPLALVMTVAIIGVAFLILLYSLAYMAEEEGYSRFFAYMNLFVAAMLILVLADNLLLLYLGWEGVGLCSYLLIGFRYRDVMNGAAARKSFVVTRVGDIALLLGIFLLYHNLGTLQIQDLLHLANRDWPVGSHLATAAALLLLGGALGKSAQLPLQTWLPDAMAGPTPVSALIHAATMVTAGVYLIARLHALFAIAPAVQLAVAVIGALTLLLAGCSALVQQDIKRVLAYSTMSQIGYMFLALGVGAWTAAIFHFLIHAFFKALLFLAAGVIILSLHHERDMFKMGGLRKEMPVVFWVFLAGAASLSAVPLVTGGFYSKEFILGQVWQFPHGGTWLWTAGIVGAFLTSLYTFRMVFLVFCGKPAAPVTLQPSFQLTFPLLLLTVLSLLGGFLQVPSSLGGYSLFSTFLGVSGPQIPADGMGGELTRELVASLVSLAGILAAYLFFFKYPGLAEDMRRTAAGRQLIPFWRAGWGFDSLYEHLLVRPFLWFARVNGRDVIDLLYRGIAVIAALFHYCLSWMQTGNVRWYAAVILLGTTMMIAWMVLI